MEASPMSQSLEMKNGVSSWLTLERRNWIALVVVGSLGGFGLGNGHTTQGAVQNVSQQLGQKSAQIHKLQTVDIPKLRAAVHCEGRRADTATVVAKQAIRGALVDSAPVPPPSALPKDNCPHPK